MNIQSYKRTALLLILVFWAVFFSRQAMAQAQRPLSLKVGILPLVDVLPLFMGLEKGYFQEEGLQVETQQLKSGPVILEAMAGGSVDIGFSGVHAFLIAYERGLDFVIVAENAYITPGVTGLFVRAESPIRSVKDLEGKTIAVNAFKDVSWLAIMELATRAGVNTKTITWVELAFPQMLPTLVNRQVDVAVMTEPFITAARKDPQLRFIVDHQNEARPNGPLANYGASAKWIGKNPELLERFVKAHKRAVDYVNAHHDEARGIIPKYTGISQELSRGVVMRVWKNRVDMKTLQFMADMMFKHGLLQKKLDVTKVVWPTAR